MLSSLTRSIVVLLVVAGGLAACGGSGKSSSSTPPPSSSSSSGGPPPLPNPAPTLASISPTTAIPGGGAFTLTVNGTNFVATSVLNWNGAARTTTFVSATQLTAQIPPADIATGGAASVTVVTPTPGGGTSSAAQFTITAVNSSVQQVAAGGTSAASERYRVVGTLGSPLYETASKSERYQLQGGLVGAGLNIP